jgi:hypothetical protein
MDPVHVEFAEFDVLGGFYQSEHIVGPYKRINVDIEKPL